MTAPARFNAGDPARRGMIAKVKIAQKELGIDDDTYRAMLERLTGKRSAADCDFAQLGAVLDELKVKGWTPKVVAGGRVGTVPTRTGMAPIPAKPARADHPAARKARALWISLHQLGVVRNGSESALEAFAARQLKVERLQWADQGKVFKLIEALKAMAERAGWSQAGDLAEIQDRLRALIIAKTKARRPGEDGG